MNMLRSPVAGETPVRSCARCSRPLSRYNDGDYCGGCATTGVPAAGVEASVGVAEIGARLRASRRRRGMTLEVLAGLAGVSKGYLSKVENGKGRLDRYSMIVALAEALGVLPGELAPPLGIAGVLDPDGVAVACKDTHPVTSRAPIGTRIADLRRARNLTQESLAERAGLSAVTVAKLEQQTRNPSLATLHAIAKALDVGAGDLIGQPALMQPLCSPAGKGGRHGHETSADLATPESGLENGTRWLHQYSLIIALTETLRVLSDELASALESASAPESSKITVVAAKNKLIGVLVDALSPGEECADMAGAGRAAS